MSAPTAYKHIVLKATGLAHPSMDESQIYAWFERLVAAVDMEVLMGPFARYCYDPGNEGMTGMVGITTSHSSIHIWDHQRRLEFDLFSCKDFGSGQILPLIIDEFGPAAINWSVFDRSSPYEAAELIEHGRWTAHPPVQPPALDQIPAAPALLGAVRL